MKMENFKKREVDIQNILFILFLETTNITLSLLDSQTKKVSSYIILDP